MWKKHLKLKYSLFTLLFLAGTFTIVAQNDDIRPPVLKTVSVKLYESDSVVLEWEHSPDTDMVKEYQIYKEKFFDPEPNFEPVDIVDASKTRYVHFNPNARDEPQTYTVLAIAKEGFRDSHQSDPHTTIHLEVVFDSCQNRFLLNWTRYEGWENGVRNYEVFSGNTKESLLFAYFFPDSDTSHIFDYPSGNFYFVVRANSTDGTFSYSNVIHKLEKSSVRPDTIYSNYLNVNDNNFELNFSTYPVNSVANFMLLKYRDNTIPDTIDLGYIPDISNISYTDDDVDVTKNYEYYLKPYICDYTEIAVNKNSPANNLVITANAGTEYLNLSWNSFKGWDGGVDYFNLYRKVENLDQDYENIYKGNRQEYEDDIETLLNEKLGLLQGEIEGFTPLNGICYYVEAIERTSLSLSPNKCVSNIVCIIPDLRPKFPDAFNPNDQNPVNTRCKPVFPFEPKELDVKIYNRWGALVYDKNRDEPGTHDGWNGGINNKLNNMAPEGVYIVIVKWKNTEGIYLTKVFRVVLFYSKKN